VIGNDALREKRSKPILRKASKALESFKKGRQGEMITQMEACWLLDYFLTLKQDEIGGLVDAPQLLVNRYATTQAKQWDFHQPRRAA